MLTPYSLNALASPALAVCRAVIRPLAVGVCIGNLGGHDVPYQRLMELGAWPARFVKAVKATATWSK